MAIYLDYAAATPVDDAVLAAMQPYWQEQFYNPSATYLAAQWVAKDVKAAREGVAACLGVRASEIIFTAGGTEADNLAIHGVMHQYPQANLVVSAVEHEAILQAAQQYQARLAPVDQTGIVQLAVLAQLVDDHTVLISCMYANNEVGTIQPIREIAAMVQQVRQRRKKSGNDLPLYLHTDASQAPNYLDMQVNRLGVDLLTLNGGKIYGPKQTGALYARAGIVLAPLLYGGGQERGLRSGTENVAGIVGLAAALERTSQLRDTERRRLHALQQQFFAQLQAAIPAAQINGSRKHRLPNNIHITIPGTDNERLVMQLDEAGILCAAGSACSAGSGDPSHVLRAMGLSDADARSSLRFTMGRATTEADIHAVVQQLTAMQIS